MQEGTKKKLLSMGAGVTLQKSGKFQEFEIVDTVRNSKVIVRGGILDGKILFREKADGELVELKGSRFYTIEDKALRLAFSAAIAKELDSAVPAKSVATQKGKEPKAKKSKVITEAGTHTHKNYDGSDEEVPADLYCNKVTCKCGNVRWVKNADMFQVKSCKPCVAAARKGKAAKRIADLQKKKKIMEKEGTKKK